MKLLNRHKNILVPFGFLSLGLCGCQTPAPIPAYGISRETPAPPAQTVVLHTALTAASPTIEAKRLTAVGSNTEPYFSPDGERFLFISRDRAEHPHNQIYEFNLKSNSERRVTYHDGNDADPTYFPDGIRIAYASETDEIKAESTAIARMFRKYTPAPAVKAKADSNDHAKSNEAVARPFGDSTLIPLELYTSKLDGSEIQRLTQSTGFDGEPTIEPRSSQFIVFSSARQGHFDLYLVGTDGRDPAKLTSDNQSDRRARFSFDGTALAWLKNSLDQKAQIYLYAHSPTGHFKKESLINSFSKNSGAILTAANDKELIDSLAWNPNGEELVFSSNRGDGVHSNLYSISRDGKCIKRLTADAFDEIEPSFSPDGKQLLFVSALSGQSQIYLMNYVAPKDCLSEGVVISK